MQDFHFREDRLTAEGKLTDASGDGVAAEGLGAIEGVRHQPAA